MKVLNAVMGVEHQRELSLLALYICKEDCPQPLPEILLSLFREGCSVTRLLAALLRCESLRMQALFTGHSKMPLHAQFEDLRHMVHDFNDLQDAVMAAGESYLAETESRTIRGLGSYDAIDQGSDRISGYFGMGDEEAEQHQKNVLLATVMEWKQTGRARLFNIFRGIPVSASVDVISCQDGVVRIRLDRDVGKVFASHPFQNHAYMACAGGKDQVGVSIQTVRETLTLTLDEVSPSFLDRRGDLGVQVIENVPVEVTRRGKRIGIVKLFDASVTGLGFVIQEGECEPLDTGEEIGCRFRIGQKEIKATGWIRWSQQFAGGVRIGMELKSDKAIQQTLQREIFRIQRQIIVEMNELDMPEAFLPFLK